jgi:hypothetical protein
LNNRRDSLGPTVKFAVPWRATLLFPEERRKALLVEAMDSANNRYGVFSVTFASLLDTKEKGVTSSQRHGSLRGYGTWM